MDRGACASYTAQGCTELNMTEVTMHTQAHMCVWTQ